MGSQFNQTSRRRIRIKPDAVAIFLNDPDAEAVADPEWAARVEGILKEWAGREFLGEPRWDGKGNSMERRAPANMPLKPPDYWTLGDTVPNGWLLLNPSWVEVLPREGAEQLYRVRVPVGAADAYLAKTTASEVWKQRVAAFLREREGIEFDAHGLHRKGSKRTEPDSYRLLHTSPLSWKQSMPGLSLSPPLVEVIGPIEDPMMGDHPQSRAQ